jgi:ribosomal protein L11 methyltransferase
VLDVGTGTGVLALAGSAMGAESVLAVDNDPAALEVARANRARNIELGTISDQATVVFDDRPLADVIANPHPPFKSEAGRFDVVVINVLLPVHRSLVVDVLASLHEGSSLITAGYLAEQEAELLAVYGPVTVCDREAIDDWVGHRFKPA